MVVEGGVEVRGFDNPHNLHAVMALMTERLGTLSLSPSTPPDPEL